MSKSGKRINNLSIQKTSLLVDSEPDTIINSYTKKLLLISELDSWRVDNHFIHTGYRKLQYCYTGCITSLTYIHNETGNIYSHVIGSTIFIFVWILSFAYYFPNLNAKIATLSGGNVGTIGWGDYIIMGSYFWCASMCMGLSAAFRK